MKIKDILSKKDEEINLKCWVISNRGNNNIRFLTVEDGSTFKNIQIILKGTKLSVACDSLRRGSAIQAFGVVVNGKNDEKEILASKIVVLSNSSEKYPIQKQEMSLEMLREIPHMRHRTNILKATMRIRSALTEEIHSFFYRRNFINVASPIITSNDGEGAGETFVIVDEKNQEFFGKKANLAVTGQLHAESYANGFGDVYTFGPTFRAENSHTQKHAAEFWMIEPEMAFTNIDGGIKLADDLLKEVISNVVKKFPDEMEFLDSKKEGLLDKLNSFIEKGVKTITYEEAIEVLKKNKDKFEEKNIEFGIDLATEHEKFLASDYCRGPIAVINYPKKIKAFYMKQNKDGKTVAAFDVLVPGIGELVGGSQRETNYDNLLTRVEEMGINREDVQWYLDLRKFGQYESTGFGLGFERLVMYVTGIDNIRDVIPFPRTPNSLRM